MKKFFIATSIVVGAGIVVTIASIAFLLRPANISQQEAAQIAIEHVGGGRYNRPEREIENWQRVWSVEVFYDGLVHEVYVSMNTGEAVRVEIDR
ncbi:PepSY domain-containing protein [Candidatus Saccharibacteria bacterium]|nr:PepSY domain-containing protein [Candidatus Saccharibacteria bacterium]